MVVLTQPELTSLMRAAGVAPAQTSPLAKMQASAPNRAVHAALVEKGALTPDGAIAPDWHRAMVTLADPMVVADVHFEGIGRGRYFAGGGGVTGLVTRDDGFNVIGGLSVDAILEDAHVLFPWRMVPDMEPLRLDLSIAELTVVAALADAHREEQLSAFIERRRVQGGVVAFEIGERMLQWGTANADHRWLVSMLSHFSVPGAEPRREHLEPGAASLIARKLAQADENLLKLGPELMALATGFAASGPFMAISVHEPWAEADVKIFVQGTKHFWGIEIGSGPSARARITRLGGRAMESMLRHYFAPFEQYAIARAQESDDYEATVPDEEENLPLAVAAPAPPPRTAAKAAATKAAPAKAAPKPATKAAAATCVKCGTALKPGKKFCTKCGTKVA